jgi:hypothetical protein
MARKYTDRNYQHKIPKSRLQMFYNKIMYTKEGKALAFTLVTMICYAFGPAYYSYKEVGRKEFMRREDRKVASAIASVNLNTLDNDMKNQSLQGQRSED